MPPRAYDRSLAGLARSASNAARAAEQAPRGRPLQKAALHVTTEVRSAIRRDTGGDMRMSGVRRHRGGARLNARYKLRGPKAYIDTTGPMPLLERDTPPRTIPKQRMRKRRTNRQRKTLKFAGVYRNSVQHPGTRGKRTFERAWKKAAPESAEVFGRVAASEIEKAWRAG